MYRLPVRLSGPILLLLGALLSGPTAASSTTDLGPGKLPHPLSSDSSALSLQRDLQLFGSTNDVDLWSITRSDNYRLDTAFGLDTVWPVADVSLPKPTQTRSPLAQRFETAARITNEPAGADPSAVISPPMPTALWILGTGMIGLSAVGRRRAPSLAVPA